MAFGVWDVCSDDIVGELRRWVGKDRNEVDGEIVALEGEDTSVPDVKNNVGSEKGNMDSKMVAELGVSFEVIDLPGDIVCPEHVPSSTLLGRKDLEVVLISHCGGDETGGQNGPQ